MPRGGGRVYHSFVEPARRYKTVGYTVFDQALGFDYCVANPATTPRICDLCHYILGVEGGLVCHVYKISGNFDSFLRVTVIFATIFVISYPLDSISFLVRG